jgi:hypothetical protein
MGKLLISGDAENRSKGEDAAAGAIFEILEKKFFQISKVRLKCSLKSSVTKSRHTLYNLNRQAPERTFHFMTE